MRIGIAWTRPLIPVRRRSEAGLWHAAFEHGSRCCDQPGGDGAGAGCLRGRHLDTASIILAIGTNPGVEPSLERRRCQPVQG